MTLSVSPIELVEYDPLTLPHDAVPHATGEMLWRQYDEKSGKVRVEFPSPKTGNRWRLTSQGWVGYIPLTADLLLALRPKVQLNNLFHMLAYAYGLQSFHILDGVVTAQSLREFYEQLAGVLAQRALARARQGVYRAYLTRSGPLPYVRGQLDLRRSRQQPWQPNLLCRYHEFTVDIPDNQIITYTLDQIARSGLCREPAQSAVRRAYRAWQGIALPHHISVVDCIGRSYHRLNQDYQPLHALCRFFLEHTGPSLASGDHTMLPFLVNMARLYELFVAQWLQIHLPSPWHVEVQETVTIGQHHELQFDIDLVLYDQQGEARAVLDTKYKAAETAATADINQIVTYAKAKRCHEAILVYPAPLARPLNVQLHDLHLRSLTFALDGNLQEAGHQFLHKLLPTQ